MRVEEAFGDADRLRRLGQSGAVSIGTEVERWLHTEAAGEAGASVFWAPCHWKVPSDWVPVRQVEQLAVLISTAICGDNNVCFVSGTRGRAGRSVNVIGLIKRQPLVWAVLLRDAEDRRVRDVRRIGYRHSNYDGFGALAAAEICWSWVADGRLRRDLTWRILDR